MNWSNRRTKHNKNPGRICGGGGGGGREGQEAAEWGGASAVYCSYSQCLPTPAWRSGHCAQSCRGESKHMSHHHHVCGWSGCGWSGCGWGGCGWGGCGWSGRGAYLGNTSLPGMESTGRERTKSGMSSDFAMAATFRGGRPSESWRAVDTHRHDNTLQCHMMSHDIRQAL